MEDLQFYRAAQRRFAARTMGAVSVTYQLSDQGQPPHIEAATLELPVWTQTQLPLQDPVSGKRYYNPMIDPITDTFHPRR